MKDVKGLGSHCAKTSSPQNKLTGIIKLYEFLINFHGKHWFAGNFNLGREFYQA